MAVQPIKPFPSVIIINNYGATGTMHKRHCQLDAIVPCNDVSCGTVSLYDIDNMCNFQPPRVTLRYYRHTRRNNAL